MQGDSELRSAYGRLALEGGNFDAQSRVSISKSCTKNLFHLKTRNILRDERMRRGVKLSLSIPYMGQATCMLQRKVRCPRKMVSVKMITRP